MEYPEIADAIKKLKSVSYNVIPVCMNISKFLHISINNRNTPDGELKKKESIMKLNPIITSLLETDQYKFNMGNVIFKQFNNYHYTPPYFI